MKINFGTIVVNKTLNYIINQEQKKYANSPYYSFNDNKYMF